MKKSAQAFFTVCLLIILAAVAVTTVANLGETVSAAENRSLALKPEYSKESFLTGDYFSGWESFLTDRAGGRDTLVQANTYAEMKLLKLPVVNGIYVSRDFLLPVVPEEYGGYYYDESWAESTADGLSELSVLAAQQGSAFIYVGIPSQLYYYRYAVPDFCRRACDYSDVVSRDFFAALDKRGIEYVDVDGVYDALGRPADFYTETDHHYSYKGAYYAYGAVMEKIKSVSGLEVPRLTEESLIERTLPNPFSGSRNRELFGMYDTGDKQSVGAPESPPAYERWDNGERTDAPVLALPETQEEITSYGVFMGGDFAETIIKTNRPELPKILVYGDSFTNALETFLYPSFDELRSLDLRYYTEKTLREYIADYKPDVIICVRDCSVYMEPSGNGQT